MEGCLLSTPGMPLVKQPVDRDRLIVPEVVVSEYESVEYANPWSVADTPGAEARARALAVTMRPAFDAVWNAGDFERSPNYGTDGEWKGRLDGIGLPL